MAVSNNFFYNLMRELDSSKANSISGINEALNLEIPTNTGVYSLVKEGLLKVKELIDTSGSGIRFSDSVISLSSYDYSEDIGRRLDSLTVYKGPGPNPEEFVFLETPVQLEKGVEYIINERAREIMSNPSGTDNNFPFTREEFDELIENLEVLGLYNFNNSYQKNIVNLIIFYKNLTYNKDFSYSISEDSEFILQFTTSKGSFTKKVKGVSRSYENFEFFGTVGRLNESDDFMVEDPDGHFIQIDIMSLLSPSEEILPDWVYRYPVKLINIQIVLDSEEELISVDSLKLTPQDRSVQGVYVREEKLVNSFEMNALGSELFNLGSIFVSSKGLEFPSEQKNTTYSLRSGPKFNKIPFLRKILER